MHTRARALQARDVKPPMRVGDTELKESSPCQPPARLCSAGDNVFHFLTVHSSVVGGEMKLILLYIDKGNLTASQAFPERDFNHINL